MIDSVRLFCSFDYRFFGNNSLLIFNCSQLDMFKTLSKNLDDIHAMHKDNKR